MAVQEFWSTLDLKNNMLKNARVEKVESLPTASDANAGRIVYTGGKFYYSNGTKFVEIADAEVVSDLSTKVTALEGTVGNEAKGLVKDVADLKAQIGTDGEGNTLGKRVGDLEDSVGKSTDVASATGTVYARIAQNKAGIEANSTAASNAKDAADAAQATANAAQSAATANAGAITTLQSQVTGEGGLQKKVAALEITVNDETTGLVKKVAKNADDIAAVKKTADAAATKTALESGLAGKVDVVEGSRLMTNAEGTKLAGIAENAQVNVIEKILFQGNGDLVATPLTITDKGVTINVSEYAKKSDITTLFKFKGTVASAAELAAITNPTEGDVYNVTAAFKDGEKVYPAGTNVVYVNEKVGDNYQSKWDALGGQVDLSAYAKSADVTTKLGEKQDALSETQLNAVNSGITAAKVTAYEGYDARITAAKSAADAAQTAANEKVVKNEAITASADAKLVTYDEKGLVTGGRAIAVADMPTGIPMANIKDTLPYAQSPVMVEEKTVAATTDAAVTIESGMTTAMIAQVFDNSSNVVFCQTTITGANVTLTFSGSFQGGKVRIVGLR
jgi:hypothetical protein